MSGPIEPIDRPTVDPVDLAATSRQLGRDVRGVVEVAHRCPCGEPDVLRTAPRLPDGTPFPTSFYATCPRLTGAVSTLENEGLMRVMQDRLGADEALADGYRLAHLDYLRRRRELGDVPEIDGISAGGMPDRVKCLHVLAAHSLAAGPGVNPLGDEVLERLEPWWLPISCADRSGEPDSGAGTGPATASDDVRRVGAIDCGTNSIRLLIADVDRRTGRLTDLVRQMRVVRLGHGVDRTGRIDPAAMERTITAAADYARRCHELGVRTVRFVATSASRDAQNAQDFIDAVARVFAEAGVPGPVRPEVVSGAEEAALSFRGATGGLRAHDIPGPYLVVDLGGGSTEFVRGTERVEAARSVDIGCVRLTERHLAGDPPTAAEIEAATVDVDAALDLAFAEVSPAGLAALVGVAGTITTVTAHANRLAAYDPAAIHLSRLAPEQVTASCRALLHASRQDRAALGFVHPGRVDVIGAGALIWSRIVERVARDSGAGNELPVVTSEHDILDGIALGLALDRSG